MATDIKQIGFKCEDTAQAFDKVLQYVSSIYSDKGYRWCFRGQSDARWPLIPKVGRSPFNRDQTKMKVSILWNGMSGFLSIKPDPTQPPLSMKALEILQRWAEQACPHVERLPDTLLEFMALAQHHGLATPLLDWTHNPLIALYFASYENPDIDGAVYLYRPSGFIDANEPPNTFGCKSGVGTYLPRAISPRIRNQAGVFTFHADPAMPLTQKMIEEDVVPASLSQYIIEEHKKSALLHFIIKAEWKNTFLKKLDNFCINQEFLFPGLGGLSRYINWYSIKT